MNTTNLFVELMVIGAGAFSAILLLVVALVGIPTLPGEFDAGDLEPDTPPELAAICDTDPARARSA